MTYLLLIINLNSYEKYTVLKLENIKPRKGSFKSIMLYRIVTNYVSGTGAQAIFTKSSYLTLPLMDTLASRKICSTLIQKIFV
ncbi:Neuronal acetylcholine receptor subunit alpha-10 [Vespula maculifrons]|uniref:Neuronal acetylcholine receptor subunit alpha-10 n=1 Tax=Vespula maculifrons TaxID=7453 RepID=A0ABD2B661_VESMC